MSFQNGNFAQDVASPDMSRKGSPPSNTKEPHDPALETGEDPIIAASLSNEHPPATNLTSAAACIDQRNNPSSASSIIQQALRLGFLAPFLKGKTSTEVQLLIDSVISIREKTREESGLDATPNLAYLVGEALGLGFSARFLVRKTEEEVQLLLLTRPVSSKATTNSLGVSINTKIKTISEGTGEERRERWISNAAAKGMGVTPDVTPASKNNECSNGLLVAAASQCFTSTVFAGNVTLTINGKEEDVLAFRNKSCNTLPINGATLCATAGGAEGKSSPMKKSHKAKWKRNTEALAQYKKAHAHVDAPHRKGKVGKIDAHRRGYSKKPSERLSKKRSSEKKMDTAGEDPTPSSSSDEQEECYSNSDEEESERDDDESEIGEEMENSEGSEEELEECSISSEKEEGSENSENDENDVDEESEGEESGEDESVVSSNSGKEESESSADDASAVSSTQLYQPNKHATSLFVKSDSTFLDPVHNFIRRKCIELFVVTQDNKIAAGIGVGPSKLGQVGLRCFYCKDAPRQELAKQAVLFPKKLATIFESVRNFQRAHLDACTHTPEKVKAEYKNLIKQDHGLRNNKSVKYVKAYYAEAASELGLVDTPNGLIFGAPPNRTGKPSARLGALIRAVESSPATRSSFWKTYSSVNDANIQMKKFEHVASHHTREVIISARRDPSPFIYPQDFPTISDIDFLTFHQVSPCRASVARVEQRKLNLAQFNALCGLCCKHCALANAGDVTHKGMYFPTSLVALADSSFSLTLLNHIMRCPNVPQKIKSAFDELKQLALDHGVITRRGSKKKSFEKVWARMEKYYE